MKSAADYIAEWETDRKKNKLARCLGILAMRKEGATFQRIGEAYSITGGRAWQIYYYAKDLNVANGKVLADDGTIVTL